MTPRVVRDTAEAVDRALVLHVMIAVAYGWSRDLAWAWLQREGLVDAMSPRERRELAEASPAADVFYRRNVEALWAIAWALGLGERLDPRVPVPDDLVHRFPDLKVAEPSAAFRARARLRPVDEIVAAADLALSRYRTSPDAVTKERWRGLRWLVRDVEWDREALDP